jgi:hypothetical protein
VSTPHEPAGSSPAEMTRRNDPLSVPRSKHGYPGIERSGCGWWGPPSSPMMAHPSTDQSV